jgi:membrane protein DedA with SNARE-associated domain
VQPIPEIHGEHSGIEGQLTADRRATVRRCLAVLGALGTGSLVGVASSLYLANHYPLLLIALSPLGRHLIVVAPQVDPLAFVLVGTARRFAFYMPCFVLGRALGPAGVDWLESRSRTFGRFVRWLERAFERWSYGIVVFFPGPTVSTIAGASGMRRGVFAALALLGLGIRMLVIISFGEWFRQPIEEILEIIDRYWVEGTVVLVAGIVAYRLERRRRANRRGNAQ